MCKETNMQEDLIPFIEPMFVLSTIHIKKSTADWLNRMVEEDLPDCIVYLKSEYGWFVVVNHDADPDFSEETNIPADLKILLQLAEGNGCDWLCLDRDGMILDSLKQYEW